MKKFIFMYAVCIMFLFPFSGLMAQELPGSAIEDPVGESVEGIATVETDATAVLNIVKENPDFSKFAELLEASDLDTILGDAEKITLFIPNNEVLAEFEAANGAAGSDTDTLIRNHIISEAMNFNDLLNTDELTTLGGVVLSVQLAADSVLNIGDVIVTSAENLGNDTIAVYPVSGVIGQEAEMVENTF